MKRLVKVILVVLSLSLFLIGCGSKDNAEETSGNIEPINTPEECVTEFFETLNSGNNSKVNGFYMLGVSQIEESNKEYMDALRKVVYSSEIEILDKFIDMGNKKAIVTANVTALNYYEITKSISDELVLHEYEVPGKTYDFGDDLKNKTIEKINSAEKETKKIYIDVMLIENKWVVDEEYGLQLVKDIICMYS